MEVSRGAKDDELGVVPKYLYNDKIMIIDNREDIGRSVFFDFIKKWYPDPEILISMPLVPELIQN